MTAQRRIKKAKPDLPEMWEACVLRVYGSRSCGFFKSRREAEDYAWSRIAQENSDGRITAVEGRVVYFSLHGDDR